MRKVRWTVCNHKAPVAEVQNRDLQSLLVSATFIRNSLELLVLQNFSNVGFSVWMRDFMYPVYEPIRDFLDSLRNREKVDDAVVSDVASNHLDCLSFISDVKDWSCTLACSSEEPAVMNAVSKFKEAIRRLSETRDPSLPLRENREP